MIHASQNIIQANAGLSGKNFIICYLAFTGAMSTGLIALGMIFHLRDFFHASQMQIGLFASLYPATYIFGCILGRRFHGSVLPKNFIIAVLFILSVTTLLMGLSKSLLLTFAIQGFFGLIISFFWPIMAGWLSLGHEGGKLGKLMSAYNFSWSSGTIISPFLAGYLSEINSALPIFTSALLFLCAFSGIFLSAYKMPSVKNDRNYLQTHKNSKLASPTPDKSTPLRFVAWLGCITAFMAAAVIINIFPIYAREILELPKTTIGALLLIRTFFTTLAFVIMGITAFWHFKGRLMTVISITGAVSMIIMIFTNTPVTICIPMILLGLYIGFAYFSSQFHGVAGSSNRSSRVAIHEAALSIGMVGGSIGGGFIFEHFSMILVYIIFALIIFAGAFAQHIMNKQFLQN